MLGTAGRLLGAARTLADAGDRPLAFSMLILATEELGAAILVAEAATLRDRGRAESFLASRLASPRERVRRALAWDTRFISAGGVVARGEANDDSLYQRVRRIAVATQVADGRAVPVGALFDRDLVDAGFQIVTTRHRVLQEALATFFHGDCFDRGSLDEAAEKAHSAYWGADAPGLASALHLMRSRVRAIVAAAAGGADDREPRGGHRPASSQARAR
jgi:hypothetical protein